MLDENQGGDTSDVGAHRPNDPTKPPTSGPIAPRSPDAPPLYTSPTTVIPSAPLAADQASRPQGLSLWLLALLVLGVGGLLLNLQELAALVAIAGMFVAAQAADVDVRWKLLSSMVSWVAPIFGAVAFFALGFAFRQSSLEGAALAIAFGFAMGSGAIAALSAIPWFANGLVALLFRTTVTSHTMRLAARLSLLCFLLAVPGWFAFRYLLDDFYQNPEALLESTSLGTGLIGYVVLAMAAVGFVVRRGWHETIDRLGLKPLSLAHLGITFLGLIALTALNIGADWIQHTFLPGLWESDQQINQAIAKNMTVGMILMLGLSAGIGEEITLRGALQPKLGITLTALLFASLHVQYSWFGMLVIFVLGMLLGVIRRYTSTTVAVLIHILYDLLAVFSIVAAG